MLVLYQLSPYVAQAHGNWGHAGLMWMWPLFVLLFWIGVAATGWFVLREVLGSRHSSADRALDILAERLASGELTPEEYRERADELR